VVRQAGNVRQSFDLQGLGRLEQDSQLVLIDVGRTVVHKLYQRLHLVSVHVLHEDDGVLARIRLKKNTNKKIHLKLR
jgi:hypothetical protein